MPATGTTAAAQNPELWFAQPENQFGLSEVTSEETKFNYVSENSKVRKTK